MEQAVKKLKLKMQKKKSRYTFINRKIYCHTELFFQTKKLDKTELRTTVAKYAKKTYLKRQGLQFVNSYSKTE